MHVASSDLHVDRTPHPRRHRHFADRGGGGPESQGYSPSSMRAFPGESSAVDVLLPERNTTMQRCDGSSAKNIR